MASTQRRFSIMKKVSLFILILVVVTIFSYGTFVIWQFKNDKLKYIHLVNTSYTTSTARKIQSHLESITNDMHNIVGFLRLSGIEQSRNSIIKIIFQNNPSFVSFGIYKKNRPSAGAPYSQLYSAYNTDLLNLKKLETKELQETDISSIKALTLKKLQSQDSSYLNVSKMNLLSFVYPLDKDQNHFGVFSVDKSFLTSSLGESSVQESTLLNGAGEVIAQKESSKLTNLDDPLYVFAKSSPITQASTEFKESGEGGSSEEYVGDFFKLGHDLILLTRVNKTKAFLDMRKLIINTIVFAFFIVGIGIFVGLIFSRSMTAPLRALMAATENFAAGNYDLQSMKVRTNDELGQLADYFKQLGKKLTEREAELEKATDLAMKDGMTGLFNHRYFISRLENFFGLSKRHGNKTSVCLIDVDFFKKFNDTYGHQQGDLVLQDLAKILKTSVRDTDLVARYGGEEFVVICPETDTEGAVRVAEKIRGNYEAHKIKNLTKVGGEFLKSTCSIGVATFDGKNFPDVASLIKQSDSNLYKAKEGGRNCVKG